MNSMEHGRIPKRGERRNRKQTDGHDHLHPPHLHNRSPRYILFLCHSRTGSEAPKQQGPEGLCIVLCKQASPATMYPCTAGEYKMGLKEGENERKERSIDRAAALLAKVWDVLYS
ncbi:hypothetical protein FJTKL_14404 [Diaporthe vaccinii]|uniref:Uncharacterized protein n=1 Tax=Diaporthe vaccinii TaxID=105482 RepID=A0ABR4E7R8_9PEZI